LNENESGDLLLSCSEIAIEEFNSLISFGEDCALVFDAILFTIEP
jgi:hypothetical protein